MEKLLSGKTLLITGGTSQLGGAFVRKALQAGGEVFFTYCRDREEAEKLNRDGARGLAVDLTEMSAIDGAAKDLRGRIEKLDVLIHNAAAVSDATIQNMTEEAWDSVLTADLKAPYYLTKKLLPLLFRSRPSKILMITSRVALTGGFGTANYAAAKAGLIALTKSLAQELGKKEILVNAVNPGFMKSRMTESLPEAVIQENLKASPLGRFSDPGEVADFLVYLASDRMSQVTGQVLHFESRRIS